MHIKKRGHLSRDRHAVLMAHMTLPWKSIKRHAQHTARRTTGPFHIDKLVPLSVYGRLDQLVQGFEVNGSHGFFQKKRRVRAGPPSVDSYQNVSPPIPPPVPFAQESSSAPTQGTDHIRPLINPQETACFFGPTMPRVVNWTAQHHRFRRFAHSSRPGLPLLC